MEKVKKVFRAGSLDVPYIVEEEHPMTIDKRPISEMSLCELEEACCDDTTTEAERDRILDEMLRQVNEEVHESEQPRFALPRLSAPRITRYAVLPRSPD